VASASVGRSRQVVQMNLWCCAPSQISSNCTASAGIGTHSTWFGGFSSRHHLQSTRNNTSRLSYGAVQSRSRSVWAPATTTPALSALLKQYEFFMWKISAHLNNYIFDSALTCLLCLILSKVN